MSGHSKWSSIKHQKGLADAKRGKIFTKLGHAITVAARLGGKETAMNPRLALAIEMAKKQNMPKDNIERAIKRGTGELGGTLAEEVTYEGYGPGGTAIYIECLTDNRNRTAAEIRTLFNKHGGRMGESGSVAYLFTLRGVITVSQADRASEEIELAILDSAADNYEELADSFIVYTDPKELKNIKDSLEMAGLTITEAEVRFEPSQIVLIGDEKIAKQNIQLMESLEELEDAYSVISNFEIEDTILESN